MEDIEFYNKLAQGYEDDLVPDETFAVAFASVINVVKVSIAKGCFNQIRYHIVKANTTFYPTCDAEKIRVRAKEIHETCTP